MTMMMINTGTGDLGQLSLPTLSGMENEYRSKGRYGSFRL